MHNIPLCRSFNYYVNPQSTSVVELGTKEHPYKSFEPVLVELMNFHTGNERAVNIYIMEETIVYWLRGHTYFSNITEVNISTYSYKNENSEKANVVGVEDSSYIVPPGTPTKFNILSKLF